jgi:hypothetical protein
VGALKGANLDVIFEGQVSVKMRLRTVDGHSLPLCGRRRVVGPAGPLAILHLDDVKRWGCDGPGFEPHQSHREEDLERGRGDKAADQIMERRGGRAKGSNTDESKERGKGVSRGSPAGRWCGGAGTGVSSRESKRKNQTGSHVI